MRRPSRLALAAGGTAAIVVAGLVVGGVMIGRWVDPPSPTTTVTADDGSEVVLDWADYPASSNDDPADVLAAPRLEEVANVGTRQLTALEGSLASVAPGLDWTLEPNGNDADSYPSGGNGYGGDSMHWGYNSPTNVGDGLDADADWHAIASTLDAELAALGYDALEWEHDREPYELESEAERDEQIVAQFGSLDPDEMWMWSGTATSGSMFVWVSIWDERRESTPEGAWTETESGVSLFVGGTVVSEADADAYAEAVAPFEGLTVPDPTHSS